MIQRPYKDPPEGKVGWFAPKTAGPWYEMRQRSARTEASSLASMAIHTFMVIEFEGGTAAHSRETIGERDARPR